MEKIYDIIVIGGGPAGYTAALYGVRAGLSVCLIEKMAPGGQMGLTGEIENYPGFDEGVDGFSLGMKMQSQAERFGACSEYATVLSLSLSERIKKVITDMGERYAKSVIIAAGADPRELGVHGERELLSRGVHYCAHCDGRFYKDKTVMVVGGGNSAAEDALYLSRLAKKVYLVHRRDSLRASKVYHEPLKNAENVEFLWDSAVVSAHGEGRLSSVRIKNLKSEEEREMPLDGLFVSIGRKPSTQFLPSDILLDEKGYILADETTKTNIPGVFAAGDIRTKALRQVITAAADGAVSAHFAEEYLIENGEI